MLKVDNIDAYYGDLQALWGVSLQGSSVLTFHVHQGSYAPSRSLRLCSPIGRYIPRQRCRFQNLRPLRFVTEIVAHTVNRPAGYRIP